MRGWRLTLVVLLALGACRRSSETVVLDLVAAAPAAEPQGEADVLLFGTPAAVRDQERGFFREALPRRAEPFAWSRRQSHVALRWRGVRPRAAVLDLAPYPDLKGQTVEVRLNGTSVGRFDLPRRGRYRLSLPAHAQRPHGNRLTLFFGRIAPPGNPHGRRLAAAVYSLAVAPEGAAALETLARPEAPAALAPSETDGVPALVQVAPSRLSYALRFEAGMELRVTPRLHPSSVSSATLRVTLEDAAGLRELWKGTLAPGSEGRALARRLSGEPGAPARLVLHVDQAEGQGPAWAVWKAPRVVVAAPLSSAEDPRAAAIREGLAGSSVVLVVLDAAGAAHLSCYGYGRETTPEIDRIAREGVLFERAYTPAVYTLAAMGSVWTSRYPDEHHAGSRYDAPLPRERLTLAELLAANGVHAAGFIANGMAGPAFGLDRGFSEFQEVYRTHGHDAGAFRKVLPDWIEAHKDRPFFLYVHFREPHFPFDPPPPFDTRFGPDGPLPKEARTGQGWINRVNAGRETASKQEAEHLVRLYDGNLAFADQELGALRRALESAGVWDRAVVIVTADHGEALLEHGFIGHNVQLHEESARIPLVVRFPPGKGPAGVRASGLVDLLDLAPTVAEVFGVMGKGGSETAFAGRSLVPLALGGPGKPAVFTRNAAGERPSHSVRDERRTFIRNSRYGHEALFDRAADPGETRDLVDGAPLEASYYRQTLFRWWLALRGGPAAEPGPARLTPEQRENLKALGYVN